MQRPSPVSTGTSLALLAVRLYLGAYLIQTGTGKLAHGFLAGGALLPQLQRFVASTPHAWYRDWLTGVVVPHERLFAILTALGETGIAIALILGALTRFSAVVGIFVIGNYLFAKGFWNPAALYDKDFLVLLLVLVLAGGGRWALDRWLWRGR
ncbi:MAG TPA: DoxX family protein [Candidatus Baltobacteraceae bacterium]|nr:DoxX family protein [Candidatus Baltobacteraceae bacterium]